MKYKEYSQHIWNHTEQTLEQVLKSDPNPIAAFDADGTLWDTDLGEIFFHYQIENKLVALPDSPWEYYLKTKAVDPCKAYLWLAQICHGFKLKEIQEWAANAIEKAAPLPIFLDQQRLIQLFLERGVTVYIITASVKWAVEPGAILLGLKHDNVIGVETLTEGEIITETQKGLITYKQGKVDALLAKTAGKKPFFASGNTMGDYQLLESATHIKLAVSAAPENETLFKTELELQKIAQSEGWLSHRFL